MLRRAIPWLLLLVALVALGGIAAFLLGERPVAPAPIADVPLSAHEAQLVGAPRTAALEDLLKALPEAADATAPARVVERLREHADRNPSLLEELAAWLRLSPEALQVIGVDHPRVVRALVALGGDGAQVLAQAYLEQPSPLAHEVRELIFRELGAMGPDAAAATPALLARAASPKGRLVGRWEAIALLTSIGPGARAAVPFLHTLVRPPLDARLAGEGAAALVAIAGPTPEVVESFRLALVDGKGAALTWIVGAARGLGKAGAPLAPWVLPYLEDHDLRMRMHAAAALGAFGDASPQVVGALARLLQDEWGSGAGDALAALGEPGRAALTDLVAEGRPCEVRLAALQALAVAGVDLRGYVPALLRLAEADDARVRHGVLTLLAALDPPAEGDAVTAWCRDHVDGAGPSEAWTACRTLARMPGGEGIGFLLAWAREGPRASRRLHAATALGDIRPEEAIQLATEALGLAEDWPATRAALQILAARSAPVDADLALSRLTPHLHDADPVVRREAVVALDGLDCPDARVVPVLLEALDDDAIRAFAGWALQKRPGSAAQSVPALLEVWLRLEGWKATQVWTSIHYLGHRWSGTAAALDEARARASPAQNRALDEWRPHFVGTK